MSLQKSPAVAVLSEGQVPHQFKQSEKFGCPNKRPIKKVVCPLPGCNRVVLQRVLARHLRTVHGHGPLHRCETCNLGFLRKDALDRHRNEQHGDSTELIECSKCSARVVYRALKEHQSSRRCLDERRNDDLISKFGKVPKLTRVVDATTTLRAAAWYLVEIGNCRRQQTTTDFAVLEARQAVLGNLLMATKATVIDTTITCAMWIFGLAEITQGNSIEAHQAMLAKAYEKIDKRKTHIRAILLGAFERWRTSQPSRLARLHPTCHIQRQYGLTTDDCDVAGCGFVTRLAGFEVPKNNLRRKGSSSEQHYAGSPRCPLWPDRSCFDALGTRSLIL